MSEVQVTTARPAAAVYQLPGTSTVRGQTLLRDAAAAYIVAKPARDKSRAMRLAWWVDRRGDVALADLDSDDIDELLDQYASEPARKFVRVTAGGKVFRECATRSPASVNRLRSALGGLLSWCKTRRLTPKGWVNPVRDTDARPESRGRVRFLTEVEERQLLAECKVSSLPRLHLLVLFALHSGRRLGELLHLRGRDLEFRRDASGEYGLAHLPLTKNGDSAALVMTDEVVAEIRRVGVPKPDDLLFPAQRSTRDGIERPMTPKKAFERAVEEAQLTPEKTGKDKVVFHVLRHSHASLLARKGYSLQRIQQSMRHKSLAMVMRYAHLAADEKIEVTRAAFRKAAT